MAVPPLRYVRSLPYAFFLALGYNSVEVKLNMDIAIIVEGKNDRSRLRRVLQTDVPIFCTYGTPSAAVLDNLRRDVGDKQAYIFTDNDASGRRIRGMIGDTFPDAVHIHTRRGYPGVEKTPEDYLIEQLEKAGLDPYIVYPPADPVPWRKEDQF